VHTNGTLRIKSFGSLKDAIGPRGIVQALYHDDTETVLRGPCIQVCIYVCIKVCIYMCIVLRTDKQGQQGLIKLRQRYSNIESFGPRGPRGSNRSYRIPKLTNDIEGQEAKWV
jgi:hypothetical protein